MSYPTNASSSDDVTEIETANHWTVLLLFAFVLAGITGNSLVCVAIRWVPGGFALCQTE